MSNGFCLGGGAGVSRQPDVEKRHLGRGDEGWRRPRPPEVLSPGISVVSVSKRVGDSTGKVKWEKDGKCTELPYVNNMQYGIRAVACDVQRMLLSGWTVT